MILRKTLLFDASRTIARFGAISRRLTVAQDRATTGMQVTRPSDAPGSWGQIHGLHSAISDHDRWGANLDRADTLFDAADIALAEAENIVTGAIERAIQAASESLPSVNRIAMAPEIGGMRSDLLRLGNTEVSGRFLFAGDAYQAAAFDATTGTYAGATASQSVRVGEYTDIELALDGSDAFQGAGDVFQLMTDLENAMASDDAVGVQALLPQLEAARAKLVEVRQNVGFNQARVGDTRALNETLSAMFTVRYQGLVEADPTAAYTDLATLQTSYQAALQVTASSSGSKLFDFLR